MNKECGITYDQAKRLLDELGLVYDPMHADTLNIKSEVHSVHGTKSALTQADLVPFLMPQGGKGIM